MASKNSSGGQSVVIDLNETGIAYERAGIRPRRLLVFAFMGLGFAGLILGVLGVVPSEADPIFSLGSSAYVALIFGVVVVASTIVGLRFVPTHAIDRIELTPRHLRFRLTNGEFIEQTWNDPSLRLEISDWSSIPDSSRSRGLSWVKYILSTNFPVEGVMDRQGVVAIIGFAAGRGFKTIGWEEQSSQAGKARLIRIVRG